MVREMSFDARASLWAACLGTALGLAAATGQAQTSATDSAGAQVLWEEAVSYAKAGDFEQACPKFAASQELDPQLGTLLALADCYVRVGKTASAWASFVEASELAKQRDDKREASARARAAELEAKLSKLKITVAEPVDGLRVRRGDTQVTEPQWGLELPVDPGEVKIVAEADGYESWKTTVTVEEGATVAAVEVPALTKGSGSGGDGPSNGRDSADEPYDMMPQLIAGAVVGGVGLVGIGVGAGFAVIAGNKDDESLPFCDPNDPTICNDQRGVDLRNDARQAQTISIVSFVAGGVLTLTGGLLVLTAVIADSATGDGDDTDVGVVPTLSPRGGGLVFTGRF
jgi:hypothetical protein